MEVHHHPDLSHKKKKFKEYFFEFIMIFLAVTMGFIAENIRERISDRNKEKEYIESLVQDLKTDTAVAGKKIEAITSQMYGLDTLEILLTPEVNKNDSAVYICYQQRLSLYNENTMDFSNRTITQLFSWVTCGCLKHSQSLTKSLITILKLRRWKLKKYFTRNIFINAWIYTRRYMNLIHIIQK